VCIVLCYTDNIKKCLKCVDPVVAQRCAKGEICRRNVLGMLVWETGIETRKCRILIHNANHMLLEIITHVQGK
jgi:hypothetical protein